MKYEQESIDETVVTLDTYNSDLNLVIDASKYGAQPLVKEGFAFMWAGARATHGVAQGKFCFELKVIDHLDVSHLPADEPNPHVVRVGFSVDNSTMQLGEDPLSYGYGGTGKISTNCQFKDFGPPFTAGDCVLSVADMTADPIQIGFAKNGKFIGWAYKVKKSELQEKALFPHILTKNCSFEVNFGQRDEPYFKLSDPVKDYTFIGCLPLDQRVIGSRPPEKREDCEMIMMCGLPGAGKSFWAADYTKKHPGKKYNVLGTNNIIDKMKVMGLPRKRNYRGRWDVLIQMATKCLNSMFSIGSKLRRNYILDQTNVYPTAQRRKMRNFDGFKRIAVVVLPSEAEYRRRCDKRDREEGKEIPDSAILEMKANFKLPEPSDIFDDVIFTELQRDEAEKLVKVYNEEGKSSLGPAKKQFRPNEPDNKRFDNRRGSFGYKNDTPDSRRDNFGNFIDDQGMRGYDSGRGRGGFNRGGYDSGFGGRDYNANRGFGERRGYGDRSSYDNRGSFGDTYGGGQSGYENSQFGGRSNFEGNHGGGRGGYDGNHGRGSYGGNRESGRGGYDRNRESGRGGYDENRESGRGGYDENRESGRGGYDENRGGRRESYDGSRGGGRGSFEGNRGGGRGSYDGNQGFGRGSYDGNQGFGRGSYDGNQGFGRGGYDDNRGGGRGGFNSNRGGGRGGYDSNRGGGRGGYDSNRGGGRGGYDSNRGGGRGGYDSNRGGGRGGYDANRGSSGRSSYDNRGSARDMHDNYPSARGDSYDKTDAYSMYGSSGREGTGDTYGSGYGSDRSYGISNRSEQTGEMYRSDYGMNESVSGGTRKSNFGYSDSSSKNPTEKVSDQGYGSASSSGDFKRGSFNSRFQQGSRGSATRGGSQNALPGDSYSGDNYSSAYNPGGSTNVQSNYSNTNYGYGSGSYSGSQSQSTDSYATPSSYTSGSTNVKNDSTQRFGGSNSDTASKYTQGSGYSGTRTRTRWSSEKPETAATPADTYSSGSTPKSYDYSKSEQSVAAGYQENQAYGYQQLQTANPAVQPWMGSNVASATAPAAYGQIQPQWMQYNQQQLPNQYYSQ